MSAPSHGVLGKMTTGLFMTYSHIHALAKQGYEIEEKGREPDYRLSPGEILHDQYVVQCSLGKGSFGQVVRALNRRTGHEVAIKIVKRLKSFTELARNEIRLLNLLKDRDPQCHHHIVSIADWFVHDGHQCIVFEMLSSTLYDVLRTNEYRGLPISVVQHIGRQLLESLLFLQANDIMHCDLKPENVLLRSHGRYDVKLIDFGSSCFTNEQVYSYIQSRFYRSPEVLLGLPYDTSIDMWSLGCILVELLTGEVLLPGANEVEQIGRMICVLGMPPARLLRRASKTKQFFIVEENGQFRFRYALPGHISVKSLSTILAIQKTSRFTKARSQLLRFLDLVERMLDYDASSRITPNEALNHAFLVSKYPGFVGRIRPRNF